MQLITGDNKLFFLTNEISSNVIKVLISLKHLEIGKTAQQELKMRKA